MADASMSPAILSYIQQHSIEQLSQQFATIQRAAISLFALVATIELALFGLVWALRQDTNFAALLFKLIKLGLVFL